ncbi:periplasmic heavy metal sensor [Sandaracinobacteroides hominis]|uniref:periplasmic heavy metal sensor n=1 Tax=Sandaracinobacteroides hominis TaxID=2780086 RepID=UPI0018F784F3|nr:periplasmic heavy metal sensor [Sandaracinobacteroides hominis]
MTKTRLMAAAVATLMAGPLLAQAAPPPPPGAQAVPAGVRGDRWKGDRMFPTVSPEGRKILLEALRDPSMKDGREDVRASRDRVEAILAADKLDVNALRKAMDTERQLIDAQQKARQDRMIAVYQKLSAADRKAFVADAKSGRSKLEKRMGQFRPKPVEAK